MSELTAKQMADKIQSAKKLVFLTGAGVSTPSGIPDYRGMDGIYTKSGLKTPEYLLSARAMMHDTEDFYQFIKQIYHPNAQPNIIHIKMAELEKSKNVSVITQNIDNLHRKAGSKVIEFHGTIYDCHCQECGQAIDYEVFLQNYTHENCGGIIRPNVVLYDEQIDSNNIYASINALEKADTVVIVGTSFKVYPFAALIDYANENADIYAINKEKLDSYFIRGQYVGDATKVFELI